MEVDSSLNFDNEFNEIEEQRNKIMTDQYKKDKAQFDKIQKALDDLIKA